MDGEEAAAQKARQHAQWIAEANEGLMARMHFTIVGLSTVESA